MKDRYTDYIVIVAVILFLSLCVYWISNNSVNGEVRKVITTPINVNTVSITKSTDTCIKTTSVSGNALGDGAIISRPIEMLGGYKHYGIMYEGMVSHFNEYGFHVDSIKDFAKNIPITVVRAGLTGNDLVEFKKRYKLCVERYKKSEYNAVNNNCEHFVNEIEFGIKRSMQSDFTKEMVKSYDSIMYQSLMKSEIGKLCIPAYKNIKDKYINDTVKK